MSSSPSREPLTGIIRQDAIVVGAVCLPDEELQDFIEQFNHCYGSIGMRIEVPAPVHYLASPVQPRVTSWGYVPATAQATEAPINRSRNKPKPQ